MNAPIPSIVFDVVGSAASINFYRTFVIKSTNGRGGKCFFSCCYFIKLLLILQLIGLAIVTTWLNPILARLDHVTFFQQISETYPNDLVLKLELKKNGMKILQISEKKPYFVPTPPMMWPLLIAYEKQQEANLQKTIFNNGKELKYSLPYLFSFPESLTDKNSVCNNAVFVVFDNGICFCSQHFVGNEEQWTPNVDDERDITEQSNEYLENNKPTCYEFDDFPEFRDLTITKNDLNEFLHPFLNSKLLQFLFSYKMIVILVDLAIYILNTIGSFLAWGSIVPFYWFGFYIFQVIGYIAFRRYYSMGEMFRIIIHSLTPGVIIASAFDDFTVGLSVSFVWTIILLYKIPRGVPRLHID